MKYLLFCAFLVACASGPKYVEEKNIPKFSNHRSYVEAPKDVLLAARRVLDELSRESDPPTRIPVKGDDNSVQTSWVYGMSRDKYMEFDWNGAVRRKPLAVRRKYSYTVNPTMGGSQVEMEVDEEIQELDKKTGEPTGWKSVETDPNVYDSLSQKLQAALRAQ